MDAYMIPTQMESAVLTLRNITRGGMFGEDNELFTHKL